MEKFTPHCDLSTVKAILQAGKVRITTPALARANVPSSKPLSFSVGRHNAFSRYENGRTRPPLALIQLFRILDRYPELLAEIREFSRSSHV